MRSRDSRQGASSSRSEQGVEGSSETKTRRPKDTRFRQQKVDSWLPILQPNLVVCIFFAIGIVFIPLGNWFNDQSDKVVEYSAKYDGGEEDTYGCEITKADEGRNCTVTIKVDEYMDPPTYVYYELDNYYQNHRRYVKSRSSAQLLGNDVETDQFCDPLRNIEKDDGETLALNPCGLIANSMFNDIIKLPKAPESYNGSTGDDFMSEKGISWESDRETRFKQPPGFVAVEVESEDCPSLDSSCSDCLSGGDEPYTGCQNYTDESGKSYKFWYRDDDSVQYLYETYPDIVSPIEGVLNEHFIVWMRTAGIPRFRKIYGRIDEPIYSGDWLNFTIIANFNIAEFSGSKKLVVSTMSLMGARNPYLGIAYIALGSLSLGIGIAFWIKHRANPRKLGDTRFMVWKDTTL